MECEEDGGGAVDEGRRREVRLGESDRKDEEGLTEGEGEAGDEDDPVDSKVTEGERGDRETSVLPSTGD